MKSIVIRKAAEIDLGYDLQKSKHLSIEIHYVTFKVFY